MQLCIGQLSQPKWARQSQRLAYGIIEILILATAVQRTAIQPLNEAGSIAFVDVLRDLA